MVVGGIVGVGIFFTPAEVARRVDSTAQVFGAWALGGVIALLGALVFAELACRRPGHGGMLVYVRAAFGDRLAFLYGWANTLVIQAGAMGVIGLVLVENLEVALFGEARSGPWARVLWTAAVILLFTWTNTRGLSVSKRVQNTLTVAKLAAVGGLVVLGVWSAWGGAAPTETATATSVTDDVVREPRGWLAALGAAILPVMFSTGGWQQGSNVAGAARHPLRDVPVGIVGGVVVVVLAYLSINGAMLQLLGLDGARGSQAIATDAARVALQPLGWGDLAARLLAGAIVVSCAGILNTILMATPYVVHAMSRDGLLPARLGAFGGRGGAPVLAVLVQGSWSAALLVVVAWLQDDPMALLGGLLDGVVFVDWLFLGACGAAVLVLRRRDGVDGDGFRAPAGGLVAGLFVLAAVGITVGAVVLNPMSSAVGVGLVASGLLARRALTPSTSA